MEQNRNDQNKINWPGMQNEDVLRDKDVFQTPGAFIDPYQFIRELQTCQIELVAQNEELHRAQKELLQSQMSFAELYDFSPVGYLTICKKGFIQNANIAFSNMLSIERASLLKLPVSACILSEDQNICHKHYQKIKETGTRQVCELRMKKNDGTFFYAHMESIVASYKGGEPVQYRSVALDISERKKLEKEREKLRQMLGQNNKMKTIATFVGGISHNFNNILFIITGNAELALEDISCQGSVHTKLEEIMKAALRAAGIVRQLLDLTHKPYREQKPIKLVSVIKKAILSLCSSLPGGIEIHEFLPDTDVMILGDKLEITQVLMNLCDNASKAMEGTGGMINIVVQTRSLTKESVWCYPGLNAGDYAEITIRDTGPGIDPEIFDQIFDPYFTTRGLAGSSGMGLAVALGIVRNHNGDITVESQPGKGTAFSVLFPVIAGKPEQPAGLAKLKERI